MMIKFKALLKLSGYMGGSVIASGFIISVISSLLLLDLGWLFLHIISIFLALPTFLLLWTPSMLGLIKLKLFNQLGLALSGVFSGFLLSLIYSAVWGKSEELQFFVIFSPLGLIPLMISGAMSGFFLYLLAKKDEELLEFIDTKNDD